MDPWLNIIEFSESSVCSVAKKIRAIRGVKIGKIFRQFSTQNADTSE
jgi:hypothetical protein